MSQENRNQENSQALLIEMGCEELPASEQTTMVDHLETSIVNLLTKNQLITKNAVCSKFSTPRRLAIHIKAVSNESAAQTQARLGPAVSAAFDSEGTPSPAALGFARSVNADIAELQRVDSPKGERLAFEVSLPGQSLSDVLQDNLLNIIKSMPLSKTMRWGAGEERFLRPMHWLLALHGETVLPIRLLNIDAGRDTYGHRINENGLISLNDAPLQLEHADHYADCLKQNHVLADRNLRIEKISTELNQHSINQEAANQNPELIAEVADLTEWPVAVKCSFDTDFLSVPKEVLEISMKTHQKFFPLHQADNSLSNQFIAFANMESKGPEQVRQGFERVIRPRLADAKFFWDQDRKTNLADYFPRLEKITFQKDIGTLADKARRTQQLSISIAEKLKTDPTEVAQAAELSLCDLATDMVGEFPELQGVIGRYYALENNLPTTVANAIEQQYWPLPNKQQVANTLTAQILVIAERTDRLLGIFAAGKKPSGNKDPFALRRAAFGLIDTILTTQMKLPLRWLLTTSGEILNKNIVVSETIKDDVLSFIMDRLQSTLSQPNHSNYPPIDTQTFRAVLATENDDLVDFAERTKALQNFVVLKDQVQSLAQANKRARNILRKNEITTPLEVNQKFLQIDAEKQLFTAINEKSDQISTAVKNQKYRDALDLLANLQQPLDTFFNDVMVMCDDLELRNNRLALLQQIQALCGQIAALDELAI